MPLAVHRRVLANGLTILTARNTLMPAVSMAFGVNAGAVVDPDHAPGTAALTARVLDKGTTAFDADAIADELEGRGASLSAGAGRQQITVGATCLIDDVAAVLPVACAVVQQPTFPEGEVATRRAELVTAIQEAADDPGSVAVDTLLAGLFPPPHPLGRPVRGRRETVEALGRAALVAHHERYFVPGATIAVAVGDLDAQALADLIEAQLRDWRGTPVPLPAVPAPPPPRDRTVVVRTMPDKSQCDVAYGGVGLSRHDPDYYPALVMNNALGQYALGGRLGDSIRERQGMAYYVYSQLDAGREAGALMVRAGVSSDNVERTIASIDQELTAVLTQGFTADEVRDAKRYLIGSLPRQLETNAGIASFLLSAELYGLGVDHDVRLPEHIARVTDDDVKGVAARLLDPAHALVVVAGPWSAPTV